jgi:hypothetical protein
MTHNLIAVITGKAKVSTKALIGMLLTFGSLMQIPAVNSFVAPLIAHHPHIASIIGTLLGIYAVLHNPQVQQVLHLNQPVELTLKTPE